MGDYFCVRNKFFCIYLNGRYDLCVLSLFFDFRVRWDQFLRRYYLISGMGFLLVGFVGCLFQVFGVVMEIVRVDVFKLVKVFFKYRKFNWGFQIRKQGRVELKQIVRMFLIFVKSVGFIDVRFIDFRFIDVRFIEQVIIGLGGEGSFVRFQFIFVSNCILKLGVGYWLCFWDVWFKIKWGRYWWEVCIVFGVYVV